MEKPYENTARRKKPKIKGVKRNSSLMEEFHKPVLVKEVIEHLKVGDKKEFIDATIGDGGHAEAILKNKGKLLGIDSDPKAVDAARNRLVFACPPGKNYSWRLAWGNFQNLKKIAEENGFEQVDGILFDLGVSSRQLSTPDRGFSFKYEGPLDMRMDPNLGVTAGDLINSLGSKQLEEAFEKFGQERYARRIAKAIISARGLGPIKTTTQLSQIIVRAVPRLREKGRLHPATRVFQALRIIVNDELNNLRLALPQAFTLLKPKGRLLVISFHSGEDRIVKEFFKERAASGDLTIITKKPIRPSIEEIRANPRSRSAKLRTGEKGEKR